MASAPTGMPNPVASDVGWTATLWLASAPLVLASGSAARRALLEAAGIPIAIQPAGIDERRIETELQEHGATPAAVAAGLARAKATTVSQARPGRLVLGADQVLALGQRTFAKPADRQTATRQLAALSGRRHVLHSAASLARDGDILFETAAEASMTMRELTPAFVERYLDCIGGAATTSVGAYQVEGPGIHLFAQIEGEQATILGLPLLPLLAFLRSHGSLAA